jgi:hypothetical protein
LKIFNAEKSCYVYVVRMADIFEIPDNFIGKLDRNKLESFGGYTIAHGRATRWHWSKDTNGDDVFEIYRGGVNEELAARIRRNRKKDIFCAYDAKNKPIASGVLAHVMSGLERYFNRKNIHGG